MAVLPIVRLGHPSLRSPSQPIPKERITTETFQQFVDDLLETMLEAQGVGLAAPQVAVLEQVFAYVVVEPDRDLEEAETRVVVNPMIEPVAGELVYDWEGCLSIPDLRGLVPRHPAVRVHALDRHGRPVSYLAEGYEARIVQHEFDHLNGIVFVDRMRDLRSLCFVNEWEEYMTTDDEDDEEKTALG